MKFCLRTYGCQMNVRDSEAVEALMIAAGHEKVASEDEAELATFSCPAAIISASTASESRTFIWQP